MKSIFRFSVAAFSCAILLGCSSSGPADTNDPNLQEPNIEIPGLDPDMGGGDKKGEK